MSSDFQVCNKTISVKSTKWSGAPLEDHFDNILDMDNFKNSPTNMAIRTREGRQ